MTAALVAVGVTTTVNADNGTDTSGLRDAVTTDNVINHMEAFQDIADVETNGGNRAAGTPGHEESADYVIAQLEAAGYTPVIQPFTYDKVNVLEARLAQVSPSTIEYEYGVDYFDMSFTGNGNIVGGTVQAVDVNLDGDRASTSGCEESDFVGFVPGNIALIQRGTCDFVVKAINALNAEASGAIIFNQGNTADREGLFGGTLGQAVDLPVVSATFALGDELATAAGPVVLDYLLETETVTVNTYNVFADTTGRADRTVVVGGHLDSVAEGPGINDNGSGTAAILETAIQMAELDIKPANRVRFAFWSGEEDGLIGSDFYVSQLTAKEIKGHALNLNFDMIGSENFVRFVYDGDGDAFGSTGPNGSDVIEDVFLDYFGSQELSTAPTEFDGRSDYFAFIENGIPAGGLFTGAEGLKTGEEAELFGGTEGQAYDACYHAECDDIFNVNDVVLEEMADAIAHATLTFAQTTSAVNGTAKGKGTGDVNLEYKGAHAIR
jgi:Zn-dependent M28 family amino/carboxypeptidase